uniref:Uncharacterized protein n=1 Tax=Cucumis melo TaxID=3656 RepID=A0A9I9CCG4_CUCME
SPSPSFTRRLLPAVFASSPLSRLRLRRQGLSASTFRPPRPPTISDLLSGSRRQQPACAPPSIIRRVKQGRSSNASKLQIIPVVERRNPSLVVAPVSSRPDPNRDSKPTRAEDRAEPRVEPRAESSR